MKLAYTLILLAFATTACFADTTPKKPHKPAASSSKGAYSATSTTARTTTAKGRATASKKSATGSKTNVRYVRNKRGKLVRVVARTPAGPSYQLHPEPERYQQIQQALTDKGYYKGEVNGVWGDDSTDALRRFQTDSKLDGDGHLTALSLTALGLGPRHDHDLSTPAAASSTAIPNDASKTGPSTTLTPVASQAPAATPKPPDQTTKQ